MALLIETIEAKIKLAIPGADVRVFNPQNDGLHFSAQVISDQFLKCSKLTQHKMVKSALKEYFDSFELHAMRLETFTQEEWKTLNKRDLND